MPSDYLFDLKHVDSERSCIFFDQLGCGRSDAPSADTGTYSVEQSVSDLRQVIAQLGLKRYHLYGQSWGGLLAFLHVASEGRGSNDEPVTITLSNTPTSVPLVEAVAQGLVSSHDGSIEKFMATHNYRSHGTPQHELLAAAYAHAGSTWRGTSAIHGLEASLSAMAHVSCPALVMRGEHDFVTAECVDGWRQLPNVHFVTLPEASHHALLEKPQLYLEVLRKFLRDHD